jgi:hypothetical protein
MEKNTVEYSEYITKTQYLKSLGCIVEEPHIHPNIKIKKWIYFREPGKFGYDYSIGVDEFGLGDNLETIISYSVLFSPCCGTEITNRDIMLCPRCLEHI